MTEQKNYFLLIGSILSISLISASLTALLLTNYYTRVHIRDLGGICQEIIERQADAEPAIAAALKAYSQEGEIPADEALLLSYGYTQKDFLKPINRYSPLFVFLGFAAGSILFLTTFFYRQKREVAHIKALTYYLEGINTGGSSTLFPVEENEFSKLQDEICKTVTMLYQTKDDALRARDNFAENLYNIAHQIKTPITAISLSVQMCQEEPSQKYLEQIRHQLSRLTRLEEALLLLSRIDAGTLPLERKEVDVFTLLTLASDNLQELFLKAGVSVNIIESGETIIWADMEWTMEALMNLLKNCMEHTPPGGMICCSYEQNPLYTEIRIKDTGTGFDKQEIPHLFERFYRGKNSGKGGIGIGLSLSMAIIENQNGTISACNSIEGGACFEIRFYSPI